ncbi:unnamed protein product [Rangifer tarandus platyrhynchus]|uniref:Uncharacterized protein n=2 Tax=Rangifer tarandus platyrhynchus TaxID=3082113 RepID=A0ACB0FIE2_RANTA|nr:unnamed protein product [Rangifer tarandus platyrhynchus]CAI9711781.1 unnamed protein product [Rangifer tarandus platyrhynchus]
MILKEGQPTSPPKCVKGVLAGRAKICFGRNFESSLAVQQVVETKPPAQRERQVTDKPPPAPAPESCGFGWALQAGARTNNAAGACIRVITTLQESPVPLTLSALFLLRGAFPSSRSRAFGLRFTLTRPIISKKCSTVPKKSRALGEVGVLERLRKMTGYPGFLAGLLRRSLHQGPSAAH